MYEVAHSVIQQQDSVLYICAHNPCNETPIVEMKVPLEKVNRAIQLLIVLPEISEFSRVLQKDGHPRLATTHNVSFVSNQSDFQHWLMLLSTSLKMCAHTLVFPLANEKELEACPVWQLCLRALGTENCSVLHAAAYDRQTACAQS